MLTWLWFWLQFVQQCSNTVWSAIVRSCIFRQPLLAVCLLSKDKK